jgi:site-specific DNA recombinase
MIKMTTFTNNFAAIYIRVANKDSQKVSSEHQKLICEEKAQLEGLSTRPEMIYEDRASGISMVDREGIKSLIEDAKKGLFTTVIFSSLSRLSRDELDLLILKRKLVNELNIRLISIEESYDSKEKDDEFIFTLQAALNQLLSEKFCDSCWCRLNEDDKRGDF